MPTPSDALSAQTTPNDPPYAQGRVPDDALRDTGAYAAPVIIRLTLATGQTFTLRGKYDYLIGRGDHDDPHLDANLADAPVDSATVSRQHFSIRVVRDGVFIKDMDSMNQTIQNQERLQPDQWYPLNTGDILLVGSIALKVSFERP
ncbi:MAG TPA: FHA domain-containing protein [Ktedonobacterales bacterium]